ncbi:flagellar hook-associated protein FlgK [Paenibacillus sp. TRM 82003]|uniref:flagellar hook-associated protein FlgK n=1 Tax=Kineococcus sp. TRM81007 TaxID=2925831 RepID=UPI001F59C694|nr:flagellar hook-associated protein FlgK [Kineococcus sp. TRM81007]MCI2240634.1 flagellar hook-associated protein FlgK [Kineococcus sp. TRM81007]MCI3925443.1 flagellar hook-associated protein FlgK [Paenibacillus sp. TRM 82003]
MSTFSGINQASRALGAAQRGMDVTGQNIANANTPGYSRQRVEQTAGVLNETGSWARANVPGDGVQVTGITRVADALATATARQDSATAAEQKAASQVWAGIETALADTGTSGLSKGLTDLSSAWNDLARAGEDGLAAARSLVVSRTEAVVSTINGMDDQLQAQYTGLTGQAQSVAADVNRAAESVAKLNDAIRSTLAAGGSANELLDQREQHLSVLADATGARTVQRDGGVVDVYVGNAALVSGDKATALTIRVPDGASIGAELTVTVGGMAATPAAGTLKGLLDGANTTLVDQKEALDEFATAFATGVNTAVKTVTGNEDLLVTAGEGGAARNLSLADGAADFEDSTADTVDRAAAKAAVNGLRDVTTAWRKEVTGIATSAQSAENRAALAEQVSLKSDAAREAVSGVNLDEEMTNLVAYQHAYSAAARVLSVIDEALSTLINTVGR